MLQPILSEDVLRSVVFESAGWHTEPEYGLISGADLQE